MSRWVAALRLTGVGFYIGGCIMLGTFGGLWLDNKLDTKPVFLLIGLVLGVIVAAFGVYQMLRPFLGNQQDKEND
jgi:ATP synthase protein I